MTTATSLSPHHSDRPMTAEEWYALPNTPERYELYEGALLLMAPPNLLHQVVTGHLFAALFAAATRAGGLAVTAPVGVMLDAFNVFEPDIVYLSPERMKLASQRGIEGAPDLVVEVASPSTQDFDRTRKLPAYFEYGVREAWLVDPAARTVAVYTSTTGEPRTAAFGEAILSTVIAAGNGGLDTLPSLP